jgi:putative glutamine amidotransferase
LIGVTTYSQRATWGPWDRAAALVPDTYVSSVASAGARPVLLPPADLDDPAAAAVCAVGALDALVLVGGGDLDPACYGADPHPETNGVDPRRDASERALLDAALSAGKPVLAICRGMQLLNVYLGGTLVQHLPDATGSTAHRPDAGCFSDVEIRTEPGSITAKVLGPSAVVRCSHHQAVDTLGAGLGVGATAFDGLVEAIELPGAPFVVGVQWHPEEELDLRLFAALVDALA